MSVGDALWMLLAFVGIPALFVLRFVLTHRRRNPQRLRGAPGGQAWVLDGGMRLLTGEAPGLASTWRVGRVVVEPGRLTMRPVRLGLGFLRAAPVSVAVTGVDAAGVQRAGLKDELSIMPGSLLYPVTTTTGATLQLALRTSRTDEIFSALAARPATAV